MGTRADFYLGRGPDAAWLASISWDGYPAGIDDAVLKATTPAAYGEALAEFLGRRDDVTWAVEAWPWPWDNSRITDYAYAFDPAAGRVFAAYNDYWFPVDPDATNGGEPVSVSDHADDCERSDSESLEAHRECEGYPFDTTRNEADRVDYPDMSGRKGDLAHIMGRSGMIVAATTPEGGVGIVDMETSAAPSVAEQGQKLLADTCEAAERERLGGLCCDQPHPTEESAEPNNEALCGNCGAAMDADMLERYRYRVSTGSESDAVLDSVNDQFERDLNAAVAGFLSDPKVRPEAELPAGPGESGYDPEAFEAAVRAKHLREEMMADPAIEAAALEGFEGNPVAKSYAQGFAAGAAAAEGVRPGAAHVLAEHLRDLEAWCVERQSRTTSGSVTFAVMGDVLTEIRSRRKTAETVARVTRETDLSG